MDYLGLVLAAHDEASAGPISYRNVPLFDDDDVEEDDHHHDGDEDSEVEGSDEGDGPFRRGPMRAPWVNHFGLTRTPFSKSIPARDLFVRDGHAEAVARINHCVAESALGALVGDVGAGKTVAVRSATAGLDVASNHVVYVPNPAFGTRGLYVTIVSALGGHPRFHKAEVMAQAASLLAAEEAERHRRVVLVIDEAHLLTPPQLEELRL